jgi:putative ABC transport system permease protein
MNLAKLSFKYLQYKPLSTFLNILLFTFGISIITVLLLFSNQLEDRLSSSSKGIDLVVGAKGSPLQLILCNIFHADFPTGNISLLEAEKLSRNRQVKNTIPLALGDSYNGYRIVGTIFGYVELYQASLRTGVWNNNNLEVTLGSKVADELGMTIGSAFESQHGLSTEGHSHEDNSFIVTGIMNPTQTVLDNLIITNIQSIWKVHDKIDENADTIPQDFGNDSFDLIESRLIPGYHFTDSTVEITSILIEFRSPMGALQLPRYVNTQTNMQAASPAFETARLFSLVGVGVDVVQGFAFIVIFIAALSIFIALFNALKERKYDLAIMRTMGASRSKLFRSILLEGLWITLLGSLFGFLLGHLTVEMIKIILPQASQSGITGFTFIIEEIWVFGASLVLGILAAIIPATQVFKTDISRTLASG